jgi:hypothetical protein
MVSYGVFLIFHLEIINKKCEICGETMVGTLLTVLQILDVYTGSSFLSILDLKSQIPDPTTTKEECEK